MAQITIQQTFDLALQHHQAGRLREAENLYRQILAQQPNHVDAMHFLGVIAHQMGRNDIAVELIRRAITLRPDYAQAHSNLGNALEDAGKIDQAIAAYQRAIALNPNLPEAHSSLGNALKEKGQLDDAITAFRQAIVLRPGYAEAHSSLGNALKENGQLDDAIAAYRKAIVSSNGYAEAYSNLGVALKDKGQLDAAILAFRQAIGLNPNLPEAHANLGSGLTAKGKLDDAIAAYRQAIALRPNYAEAHSNLGVVMTAKGQLDDAIAAYRHAMALRPNYAEGHSRLLYTLHFHPAYDAQSIAEEHRRWNRQHAESLRKFIQPHTNSRDPDRRLRIGYVSPDFRQHCQSFFTVPLLSNHDRTQFEIFCYADVPAPDDMTARLKTYADHWRPIADMSDEKLAQLVRTDQIDLLIDLSVHMGGNHLLAFARKPAPVQITWLGYPGTTGMNVMDWRLTDPYLDPPHAPGAPDNQPGSNDAFYSERSFRLPDTFWCYDPLTSDPPLNDLPALNNDFVTFGCLNNLCKLNDVVLALWSRVLLAVPRSRLIVRVPPVSAQRRVLVELQKHGIDPGRVQLIGNQSRVDYLATYHRIDIALDTFPYNGHTTSLDSLWMGVPVVTYVGSSAVARAGWCQLSNLGLAELAGKTAEEFVRIAVELAKDLPRLEQLRSTLRQRMEQSPLMDAPRFARNIEAAYRQMWRTWCETVSTGD